MSVHRRRFVVVGVSIMVLAGFATTGATRQGSDPLEHFRAIANNTGTVGRRHVGIVDILVTRWSTRAEKDKLSATTDAKGPDALLDTMRGMSSAGSVRTPDGIVYDLHFAWNEPVDSGGRRIILATCRPLGFWNAALQSSPVKYPFTLIELRLNSEDEGEGKMSIATAITTNMQLNLIELADYANEPVRLMLVQAVHVPTP